MKGVIMITIADMIRNMPEHELAGWLDNIGGCTLCSLYNLNCPGEFQDQETCHKTIEAWLRSEVTKDNEL